MIVPIDIGGAYLEGILCFVEGHLSRMDGHCHTGLSTAPEGKGQFPSSLPFVFSASKCVSVECIDE